jgi:hypothetical protein
MSPIGSVQGRPAHALPATPVRPETTPSDVEARTAREATAQGRHAAEGERLASHRAAGDQAIAREAVQKAATVGRHLDTTA